MLSTVIGACSVILSYKVGLHFETNILCTKNSALRADYINLISNFGMQNSLCLHSMCSEFVDKKCSAIQYDSEFCTVHFFLIKFVDMNQAFVNDNRLSYVPINRIMPMLSPAGNRTAYHPARRPVTRTH